MTFEPISNDTNQDVHVIPSFLRLPKGASSSIKIPIINNSSDNAETQPKTLLGYVFQIQSVQPL